VSSGQVFGQVQKVGWPNTGCIAVREFVGSVRAQILELGAAVKKFQIAFVSSQQRSEDHHTAFFSQELRLVDRLIQKSIVPAVQRKNAETGIAVN